MKKKYINPTIMVVKIQTAGMLAISKGEGTVSANDSDARDFDFDEDEY